MAAGCTNIKAVNYDPSATEDDGSCIYLASVGGVCYEFKDVATSSLKDTSFTMSFAAEGNNWVFFHDYIPDFYIQTRDKLFNLKNNKIYKFNDGPYGVYHDRTTTKSFFIDAVFRSNSEMTLNAVNWISEVFTTNGQGLEWETLTHITIWNTFQCTGRIPLTPNTFELLGYPNMRKTQAQWSFNNFRNELEERGIVFLQDLFANFAVIPSTVDNEKPWYDRDLLEDEYFMVRFEFDNMSGNQFILHDVDIDANKSYR